MSSRALDMYQLVGNIQEHNSETKTLQMSFTFHNKTQDSGNTGESVMRHQDDSDRYELGVESLSLTVMWQFLVWMAVLTSLMVLALVLITQRNRIYDW